MASDAVKGAWISGILGAIGTVVAAVLTNGFGLGSPHPVPSLTSPVAATTVPAVVTTPSSPAPTSADFGAVPSGYEGTWTGWVTQWNGSSYINYLLVLKIGSGAVATTAGSWEVPAYGCGGYFILESGGGPLEIREVATYDPNSDCFSQFDASVTLNGSQLDYRLLAVTNASGQPLSADPLGTGTLNQ
jgi:hypothetical protein